MVEAADPNLRPHDPIDIYGNDQLTRENGVVRGQGTPTNPFIIEGWDISPLPGYGFGVSLSGTDAWVVIRNVRVQPGGYFGFNFGGVSNIRVENVSSSGAFIGIMLHSSAHVTISKAAVFQNYKRGIHLYNSANITISDSTITRNDWVSFDEDAAVRVDHSSNVTLSRNEISSNLGHGLRIEYSRNTSLFENTISFNGISGLDLFQTESVSAAANTIVADGITLFGTQPSHVRHTIGTDNTVDGKPVYYYSDCNNVHLDAPSAGQLIIANCQGFQVSNLEIGPSAIAVQIFFSNNVQVSNGKVSNSGVGIVVGYSSNVTVAGTSIQGNVWGVNTYFSSNLLFHHNNFVGNNLHAREFYNYYNVSWNAVYPIGGNYWSDYAGSDNCSGPGQDQCSGPDGFGDTLHMGDHYPLLRPVSASDIHNVRITGISSSAASVLQGHTLQITVSARNGGTVEETFQVTLSANQTQIGSQTVTLLSPGTDWPFSFSWSTAWVPSGIYAISAATSLVYGDTDPGDNWQIGSPVTVDTDTVPPTWPDDATLRSPTVNAIGIDLEWSSATDNGVVEYRLYQNSALVGSSKGNTATVGNLKPDTIYAFKLEAVDGGNNLSNDGPSLIVRTTPDTSSPTWSNSSLLYAAPISFDTTFFWTVTLSWTSSAQDNVRVTNYRVYQDGSELALLPGDARYYTVTGLVPTTKHIFKVEAGDAGGNWSADGPSANVTLPPCQGACIYYALTYEGTPSSGSSITLLNDFTDGGVTRVRVTRVEVTTDFGTFTWTPPSTSTPCLSLACEIPEAINLSTGEKKGVRITMNIPSGTLPRNYTVVAKITWQYFEQQYDYLYGRTFWVWSQAPPLTLQGSIIVTRAIPTNEPPDTTGPIPDIRELPTIPLELLRSLLSPGTFPLLVGGYVMLLLSAVILLVSERRKTKSSALK